LCAADNPEAAWNWRIGGASAFDEEEVAVSGARGAADDDGFLSGLVAGLDLHDELSPEQKDLMRVVLEQVRGVRGGLLPALRLRCAYASCIMRETPLRTAAAQAVDVWSLLPHCLLLCGRGMHRQCCTLMSLSTPVTSTIIADCRVLGFFVAAAHLSAGAR
jgi:hypothetical protein